MAFCMVIVVSGAWAQNQEEPFIWFGDSVGEEPEGVWPDHRILPINAGPLDIGGAFRFNYSYRDWQTGRPTEDYDDDGQMDLDTIRVNIDLEDIEPWIGSFEYRYYRYRGAYSYNMLHHGWLGYQFNDMEHIEVGVTQVPFGILPYASHNWFFQLPYYVGLEDDYDLGFKYVNKDDPWNWQFAYYPRDEGNYNGKTDDSTRYSYDVVEVDSGVAADAGVTGTTSTTNEERHQFNARVTHTMLHDGDNKTELGLSAQYGLIDNEITDDYGNHYALGAHLDGYYGPWNAKLEAITYEYDLENPDGVSDKVVPMGAYDFPYPVATDGHMLVGGLSRDFPVDWGPIKKVTLYNDYSVLFKTADGFENTYQNVAGMSFAAGRWFIYVDVASAKRHPWFAAGDGLGSGTGDSDWNTRFNINFGYYF